MTKRTVAIVGASGGIGSALARRLSRNGVELLLISRDASRLAALREECGGQILEADATQPDHFQELLLKAGPLQGLVNCAGSVLLKPAHLTTEAEWKQTLDTNLTTAFATVRGGAKAMMQTGGSIVLCSTAAARIGLANHEAIAAAKGGVIGLTLSAAASYAGRNIRVNCVAPGLVDTPLTARIMSNEASLKASLQMHPLGRAGRPEQIASGIDWLLDPENDWVTGQVIGVDGGLGTLKGR